MAEPYNFREIEEKWLPRWEATKAWAAPRIPAREKRYVLEMYPYPSGDMHVGHVENYAIGDAFARYWKMQGFDVLHPFGYDAFGLPAENAAIEKGIHPRESTYANIEKFTASCKKLAYAYDWDRCQITCDPSYYKWNQWLFLRLFERGLAYRKAAKVNWCPKDKTVLANEQISNGVCWRCGSVPEIRDLDQWFFKTTEYAQRLLDDMDQLDWGDAVLTQQRHWIGRSEGARVTFMIAETGDEIEIFTTRPDTLYGVTFFVFAAEHPIAAALAERAGKTDEYKAFVDEVRRATDVERLATQRERKAFDLLAHAVNPLNGEEIPVFASDYVLMEYGTGAIMAVPAHDQRDYEFAQQMSLPIRVVVEDPDGNPADTAHEGEGVMVESGPFTGTHTTEGRPAVIKHLEEQAIGKSEVQYRLRDWLISRQRYWGTPIPVVYCERDGIVAVPDSELPVELPTDADYHLSDDAVSPLAKATEWVNTTCPKCGGPAKRETDTMDTFVDSSWYFLRFCDAHNEDAPFERKLADAWMSVDQYTGGIEQAVMHLIYARFVTKFLHDIDLVSATEPFKRLLNHGTINMEGKRMSKSRGNIVEPGEVLDMFGADTLRLHMLFINPPDAPYDWPAEGARACVGSFRFLSDVWKLVTDNADALRGAPAASGSSELRRFVHQKLRAITGDYERWAYNTAISKLMELRTEISRAARAGADPSEIREGIDVLLHSLAPFCPYITEELWERLGGDGSIHERPWPTADATLATVERTTLVVQVDSKVRDKIEVPTDIGEHDAIALARASEKAKKFLDGEPKRVIARPPKLVNFLTR
jgi:leucyl-tRNA synthetase